MKIIPLIILFFLIPSLIASNEPIVIKKIQEYKKIINQFPHKKLVNLQDFIPNIELDIRYATENNFLKTKMYPSACAFLQFEAALALKKVQEELNKKGLGLKIFDAYRPYSVSKKMWEIAKSPYVADPQYGSNHNRGCAVDLTIISLIDKKEIEMPTAFDEFSIKSSHKYNKIPEKTILNRNLLKNVMEKYGFIANEHEWWHYDFKNAWQNNVLDLSFNILNDPFLF